MSDNVKSFPGIHELPVNPLQVEPTPYTYCGHAEVVLDEHNRVMTCANPSCGATLDPFNFLLGSAKTIQRAWDNYRHVSSEATQIAERVSVLKKEEARLRAMLKRLQDKGGVKVALRGKES